MSKTINKVERTDEIAKYYGFKKTDVPSFFKLGDIFLDSSQKKNILEKHKNNYPKKGHNISMLYNNQAILTNKKNRGKSSTKNFNFDILGVSDSIAEATIIHTAITSLKEEGYKNPFVNINSLGDKHSLANFRKSLFDFYKSRIDDLHPKCRNFNKKNIFNLLSCNHKECQELKKDAPRPIYFLSNDSQQHLKKTLEYLESLNIIYNIDDLLMESDNCFSNIIFEIKHKAPSPKKEIILGRGGRYDELARNILRKRNLPAVGVSLEFPSKKSLIIEKSLSNKSDFYFIQFGPSAKQKSLPIIEMLRRANLKINQDLHIDKFGEQIDKAREMKVRYILILGQKEADDGTLIIKDLKEASQKTVKLTMALNYIKQLK
ncbi:MAG: ATP phosphoribosyltransferase regulatory subunit [Candidatus Pacebacteria bacterium]|nr:ATP phosphoribosyltransferase regulatory subunit [Candidatus Paceibacterota bacterium]